MNWNMKKVSAYRRSAGLAMAVVMSVHILIGPGFFCAKGFLPPFRSVGTDLVVFAATPPGHDSLEVAGTGLDNSESQRGTSNCSCKKQKKCPAIPRAIITTNPTHRFYEVQLQAKLMCPDYFGCQATDHRFGSEENRLLIELSWCSPFCCTNPLALTSVLLI